MKKHFLIFIIFMGVVLCHDMSAFAVVTEKGLFDVDIQIEGGDLVKGKNIVYLTVLDKKGKGVEGVEIEITPWTPMMNQGAPWHPKINDLGAGSYRTNIPITMGGYWEFRVSVSTGGSKDKVVFEFQDVEE